MARICRPVPVTSLGFARCFGFDLEGWNETKPSFICIDRIDGQNGVLCPDATAGIPWEEALCQRKTISSYRAVFSRLRTRATVEQTILKFSNKLPCRTYSSCCRFLSGVLLPDRSVPGNCCKPSTTIADAESSGYTRGCYDARWLRSSWGNAVSRGFGGERWFTFFGLPSPEPLARQIGSDVELTCQQGRPYRSRSRNLPLIETSQTRNLTVQIPESEHQNPTATTSFSPS
jgi:hypothetical protein